MADITIVDVSFDAKARSTWELDRSDTPSPDFVHGFSHFGYNLTRIESEYSMINGGVPRKRQPNGFDRLSVDWFSQQAASEGAVLSKASLMERKGFDGPAYRQAHAWAKVHPVFGRLLTVTPMWGLVFSIDWSDRDGNCFEMLHLRSDSDSHQQASDTKGNLERKLCDIDWDDLAARMIRKRQHWEMLNAIERRAWQAEFVGI